MFVEENVVVMFIHFPLYGISNVSKEECFQWHYIIIIVISISTFYCQELNCMVLEK